MTIPPIGALSGLSLGSTTGASEAARSGLSGAAGEKGGFAGALGKALNSLEQSQQTAESAAKGIATGTVSNPESALVQVEQAQLEMQLASQIRAKATESLQNVFQTQV